MRSSALKILHRLCITCYEEYERTRTSSPYVRPQLGCWDTWPGYFRIVPRVLCDALSVVRCPISFLSLNTSWLRGIPLIYYIDVVQYVKHITGNTPGSVHQIWKRFSHKPWQCGSDDYGRHGHIMLFRTMTQSYSQIFILSHANHREQWSIQSRSICIILCIVLWISVTGKYSIHDYTITVMLRVAHRHLYEMHTLYLNIRFMSDMLVRSHG